ncbi:M48 family metalloprotease [Hydrogenophaga sp. 5NK40-0174]|uniref:M48 family metalloprotease n=1 Tax=Hydrogenophaga sp. 5NK40-0174 TaxID=3127649 RepID=UPI00310A70D8
MSQLRLSEIEAQSHPASYRRKTLWFAWLGYGYAILSIVFGLALVALALWLFSEGRSYFAATNALIGGVFIAWVAISSVLQALPEHHGIEVTADEAPELFKLLEKIRRRLKGPSIHRVLVDDQYNASISQAPRWGLVGPTRNTLCVGLPLMMALDRNRLTAVLSHEYAHLRGGDGSLATFLYRTRRTWSKLAEHFVDDDGKDRDLYSAATRGFLNWYAPRFLARSFALARQEEYTADRLAGELVGMDTQIGALMEMRLRSAQMNRRFWERFWAMAPKHELPPKKPWAWALGGDLPPPLKSDIEKAMDSVRVEVARHDDTHPTTRERVKALGGEHRFPGLSKTGCTKLLGPALDRIAEVFDTQWWQAHHGVWKEAYRTGQRDLAKIAELKPEIPNLGAADLVRLARLVARTKTPSKAIALYQAAIERDPDNAEARWKLAIDAAERNDLAALGDLAIVARQQPHMGYAAARAALELIERQPYEGNLGDMRREWKETLHRMEALEDDADSEVSGEALLDHLAPHDLSPDEEQDVCDSARLMPQVRTIWVMRRPVKALPGRRQYVIVVEFRRGPGAVMVPLDEVADRIDLPGPVWAIEDDDLNDESLEGRQLPLADPVYPPRHKPEAGSSAH